MNRKTFAAALVLIASAGSALAKPTAACPVTGKRRVFCCASKGAPMPPCCERACDTPGRIVR